MEDCILTYFPAVWTVPSAVEKDILMVGVGEAYAYQNCEFNQNLGFITLTWFPTAAWRNPVHLHLRMWMQWVGHGSGQQTNKNLRDVESFNCSCYYK